MRRSEGRRGPWCRLGWAAAAVMVIVGCNRATEENAQTSLKAMPAPAPIDLRQVATANTAFRRTPLTGPHLQVSVMNLAAGEAIGLETHPDNDQLVYVVAGQVTATVGKETHPLRVGGMVLVPAGAAHDVMATGPEPAKIMIVYAPPLHPPGEVELTKPADGH